MRVNDIKFRVRNTINGETDYLSLEYLMTNDQSNISVKGFNEDLQISQYTGLKDKKGVDEVYEGDIITDEGLIRGNIHEIQPRKSDLVIPRITSETWETAYKIAMDRGLFHT